MRAITLWVSAFVAVLVTASAVYVGIGATHWYRVRDAERRLKLSVSDAQRLEVRPQDPDIPVLTGSDLGDVQMFIMQGCIALYLDPDSAKAARFRAETESGEGGPAVLLRDGEVIAHGTVVTDQRVTGGFGPVPGSTGFFAGDYHFYRLYGQITESTRPEPIPQAILAICLGLAGLAGLVFVSRGLRLIYPSSNVPWQIWAWLPLALGVAALAKVSPLPGRTPTVVAVVATLGVLICAHGVMKASAIYGSTGPRRGVPPVEQAHQPDGHEVVC